MNDDKYLCWQIYLFHSLFIWFSYFFYLLLFINTLKLMLSQVYNSSYNFVWTFFSYRACDYQNRSVETLTGGIDVTECPLWRFSSNRWRTRNIVHETMVSVHKREEENARGHFFVLRHLHLANVLKTCFQCVSKQINCVAMGVKQKIVSEVNFLATCYVNVTAGYRLKYS